MITMALFTLSLLGCAREEPLVNLAPPIIGFGTLTQSMQPGGDKTVVLYLNKSVQEPIRVNIQTQGSAVRGIDYAFVGDTSFLLQPGAMESTLSIRLLSGLNNPAGKNLQISLIPNDQVFLAPGRETLTINFLSVQHTADLSIWAKDIAFPQLFGYTSFSEAPIPSNRGEAGEHFGFAYKSATEQNVIGFYGATPTQGTNAFNMIRLYAANQVSSGSAAIRIPRAIRLIPDNPGAKTGNAEVIDQWVRIIRTANSGLPPFEVRIWGSGRYNEITGIISLDIHFDESAIGGSNDIIRKYSYEKDRRPA
jgi:hypothetical protein